MKPNENFTLNVNDIDLIENALNYQISRLLERRRTHVESTVIPEGELVPVKKIDTEITVIRELLGRIHNQKAWYRPKDGIYVSG